VERSGAFYTLVFGAPATKMRPVRYRRIKISLLLPWPLARVTALKLLCGIALREAQKARGAQDAAMWHAMSVFCLADSMAMAHKKALFGNKGSRAIAAETPQDLHGQIRGVGAVERESVPHPDPAGGGDAPKFFS
jgi:hypothetical protein